MDFFGFSSADLSTPIGQMIKSGTDSLLLGPDWSKNLEICDLVSNTREGPEHALKAIVRRLQDSDHNTVFLALTIFETCFKNCGTPFVSQVNKSSMDELVNVAKGSRGAKNAHEALRLIQEWGRAYESRRNVFPLFFDTYVGLKSKGLPFPREEPMAPAPSVTSSANNRNAAQQLINKQHSQSSQSNQKSPYRDVEPEPESPADESGRLEKDLEVVMEKVRMCREMLLVSPGIHADEILSEVVGFLEACRDRLAELIEAGTQGVLAEDQFASVLKVNDAVLRTLDAEKSGKYISVDEEDSRKEENKTEDVSGNLLDLSLSDSPKPATTQSTLLSAAEDDVFGLLDNKAPIKVGAGPKKATPVKSSVLTPPPQPVVSADALAFDPFSIQSPPPAPVVVSEVQSTPTPFDNLLAVPPPVATAQPAAAGAMTDADFDAFFADLKK